jgi:bifunctional non-homologous end joining protein LigD
MAPPLPMKATAGPLPVGPEWVYEVKWDGMRLVVTVEPGDDGEPRVRLTSANGNDATAAYPELGGLGAALGVRSAVLDGEVVAFDDAGRPDFGRLQQRMHVADRRQAARRARAVPTVLLLFDLLALDGHDLCDLPLVDRRRLLEQLVQPGPHWQVPAFHEDGEMLLAAAEERDLEGLVAKRRDSTYRPGSRTREWVKVKVRRRQEFGVGGWAPGEGRRSGGIGGLLVGYHDGPGGALRYAGRVGSGLTEAEIETLIGIFAGSTVDRCPFDPPPPAGHVKDAVWVEPTLVVEVAFAEWTGDGRLRHPTYAGRRIDKDPGAVTAEP